LVKLGRRESEKEEIVIPSIQVLFLKVAYVRHSKDMTNASTQGLAAISINTLEQDDNKVKSCNEKGKVMEGEDLLPQLTVHIMKEMSTKTFV
jgi:hypothetical protein